jgi:hypothetical protein
MLRSKIAMSSKVAPGEKRIIDGQWRVYYDGYWIKVYNPPADTLLAKKRLIEALTRRLFNHVEHGVNIPGARLEEARRAYDAETDAAKKRVKAAMLAGALFNRATDVFTKIVEIQALGVEIGHSNALMRQCGEHLKEALELGQMVLHRSGEEGIDELWGEPFKAFAFPIEDFYESRYLKIAQTMGAIDEIAEELMGTFGPLPMFAGIDATIRDFAAAAKVKSETLQTDANIFDVWSSFVASSERLGCFRPSLPPEATLEQQQQAALGLQLVRTGRDLVSYITRARVPMPKSTRDYIERCHRYRADCTAEAPVVMHVQVERTGPENVALTPAPSVGARHSAA